MPRKKRVLWEYAQYADQVPGHKYLMGVDCVHPDGRIRLTHRDGDQEGRTVEMTLPLPIRPQGITAEFCRACSLTVDPEHGTEPDQAVGRMLCAVFGKSSRGVLEIVSFAAAEEGNSHDTTA